MRGPVRHLAWALSIAAAPACNDPVRQAELEALGEEAPGVPEGPLHRPGQPCLACHGGEGPADSEFAFAGTLYQEPDGAAPLHDATVRFIDSARRQYQVTSNCAGNFWVAAANFDPVYPVWIQIAYGDRSQRMTAPTFRAGSCATCHFDPPSPRSAGPVYLSDTDPVGQEPCPR